MLFTRYINLSISPSLTLSLSLTLSWILLLPLTIIYSITRSAADLPQSQSASSLLSSQLLLSPTQSLPAPHSLFLTLSLSALLMLFLQHESLQFPLDTVFTSLLLINSQPATCAKKKEKLAKFLAGRERMRLPELPGTQK